MPTSPGGLVGTMPPNRGAFCRNRPARSSPLLQRLHGDAVRFGKNRSTDCGSIARQCQQPARRAVLVIASFLNTAVHAMSRGRPFVQYTPDSQFQHARARLKRSAISVVNQ